MADSGRDIEKHYQEILEGYAGVEVQPLPAVTWLTSLIIFLVVPGVGAAVGNIFLTHDDDRLHGIGRAYLAASLVNLLVVLGIAAWLWWPS